MVGGGKVIEQAVICPTTPLYDPSPVRQRYINVFLGLQLSYASIVHREPAQPTANPRASSKIPKVHHILGSEVRKIQSKQMCFKAKQLLIDDECAKNTHMSLLLSTPVVSRSGGCWWVFPSAMSHTCTEPGRDAIFPLLLYNFEDIARRWFWRYIHSHVLTMLEMLEHFGYGFDLEQKLYKKGWPLELYQRCLIWNVTDEPPDNGDHRFSGSPDVPWTIIWPETFREC